jgi:Peptidase inhibitor family I36
MKHIGARVLGVFCLALLVGVVAAGTATAAEPAAGSGPDASATNPLAVTPMVLSECPGSYICFWTGKTYGQAECNGGENCFSAFHGYETGCHALASINPQSIYNHTGEHYAHLYYNEPLGPVELVYGPGQHETLPGRYSGEFCIS